MEEVWGDLDVSIGSFEGHPWPWVNDRAEHLYGDDWAGMADGLNGRGYGWLTYTDGRGTM